MDDRQPSMELLELARDGSSEALDRLLSRYLRPLKRWAHNRLPYWARTLGDTEDLVQEAVAQTLKQLPRLRIERQGGLHAYLKAAILNRIRTELRNTRRRPQRSELDPELPSTLPSALDQAIGNERRERYEWALARLSQGDREAIIARFEFGFSGLELAAALHKPTADAARMAVTRAVVRLTRTLGQAPPSPRGSTTPTLT